MKNIYGKYTFLINGSEFSTEDPMEELKQVPWLQVH
jgi:hypothetical protein